MCSKLLFYTIHTVSSYSALQIAEHVNPVLIILVCTINAFSNPCNPCNHKKLTLHPHTHLGLCGNATEGRRWGKKKLAPHPHTHLRLCGNAAERRFVIVPSECQGKAFLCVVHTQLPLQYVCGTYTVTVVTLSSVWYMHSYRYSTYTIVWYIHSYCCKAFLCVVHRQLPLHSTYTRNSTCTVHTL